jgi:hypothetical protein
LFILGWNQDILPNIPWNKKGEDPPRSKSSAQSTDSHRALGWAGHTQSRLLQSARTYAADSDLPEFGWTILLLLLSNRLSIKIYEISYLFSDEK